MGLSSIYMPKKCQKLVVLADGRVNNKAGNQALLQLGKTRFELFEEQALGQGLANRGQTRSRCFKINTFMCVKHWVFDLQEDIDIVLGDIGKRHKTIFLCERGFKFFIYRLLRNNDPPCFIQHQSQKQQTYPSKGNCDYFSNCNHAPILCMNMAGLWHGACGYRFR